MGKTGLIFQHYAIHAPCLSIWEGHHSKEKNLEITLGFPVFIVEQITLYFTSKNEGDLSYHRTPFLSEL